MSAATPAEIAQIIKNQRFELEVVEAGIEGRRDRVNDADREYMAAQRAVEVARDTLAEAHSEVLKLEAGLDAKLDLRSDIKASIAAISELLTNATLGEPVELAQVEALLASEVPF